MVKRKEESSNRPKAGYLYSHKYAERAKKQREAVIAKAVDLIKTLQISKATSYGAANYVANIEFDKVTGEVLDR